MGRLGRRRSLANDEIGEAQDQKANTSLADSDTPTEAPIAYWSDWRIDLMERLWGTGFLLPGGTEFVSELTRPLNLGSKTSVLVLGAGMGGPSNSIAKEFGAFIDGIEPDPELAVAGVKRAAIVKGMSRVTIKNLSIDDDSAFARKYDAIFGQEILLQRANVSQLLDRCANALKENGKLVITDFTSADETAGSSIEAWLKREKAAGSIREEGELRALFTEAGFRMRTVEDLTDRYIGLVHNGWVALERSLRANAANRDI
ncbi:MAG: methyltransferase domain-containing protein, partial [Alphaproteobacteria bacterium]|nr:methyltransferase domain-containing protein [Alphaproteobacteria bacterium]